MGFSSRNGVPGSLRPFGFHHRSGCMVSDGVNTTNMHPANMQGGVVSAEMLLRQAWLLGPLTCFVEWAVLLMHQQGSDLPPECLKAQLNAYLWHVLQEVQVSHSVVVLAMVYIHRFFGQKIHGDLCGPCLFVVALITAHKYLEDLAKVLKEWGAATGLPSSQLAALERSFLRDLDFQLSVSTADFDLWKGLYDSEPWMSWRHPATSAMAVQPLTGRHEGTTWPSQETCSGLASTPKVLGRDLRVFPGHWLVEDRFSFEERKATTLVDLLDISSSDRCGGWARGPGEGITSNGPWNGGQPGRPALMNGPQKSCQKPCDTDILQSHAVGLDMSVSQPPASFALAAASGQWPLAANKSMQLGLSGGMSRTDSAPQWPGHGSNGQTVPVTWTLWPSLPSECQWNGSAPAESNAMLWGAVQDSRAAHNSSAMLGHSTRSGEYRLFNWPSQPNSFFSSPSQGNDGVALSCQLATATAMDCEVSAPPLQPHSYALFPANAAAGNAFPGAAKLCVH